MISSNQKYQVMHKDLDDFSFIDEISNDIFYGLNEDFFFKKKPMKITKSCIWTFFELLFLTKIQ